MEHRHIASFGIYSLLLAATPALAAPSGDQAVKGPYRGSYVCEINVAGVPAPVIFRVPIDLVIRNGNVEFSRPLVGGGIRTRARIIGNEMASGTMDADGKVHLTSTWYNSGAIFHGDYSGTLTPSGGTFIGTQTWHGPRQNGSRTCTAALVQFAAINRSPPQQSLPDQTPPQQSLPGQSPSEQ